MRSAVATLLVARVVAQTHTEDPACPTHPLAMAASIRDMSAVEGGLILQGQKRWCSGAGHSDMIVFCKMDPSALGAKGLGAVYVKRDAPGVSFGEQETLMGPHPTPFTFSGAGSSPAEL